MFEKKEKKKKIANHFRIGNSGEIGLTYFEVRYFRQTWTDADRRG